MATIVRGKNPNKPYTVRYFHDGRQRERSFELRKDARDFMAKFEHDSRDHSFVDPKMAGEKFGIVAKRWLAKHPGTNKTKRIYESVLRMHILPVFGPMSLSTVAGSRATVELFLRETLPGKGLGASSIATCYMVLKAIVNDSIKAGRLGPNGNRLRGIVVEAVPQRANLVFATHEQVVALAEKLPDPYGFSVYLMRGCGLRLGEALGVCHEDFRDRSSLRLSRQLSEDGKSVAELKHRNADDYRDIPVPGYVLAAIPPGWDAFPPVNHRTYRKWFKRGCDAAGLPLSFTPHVLRHTFASVALSGGVPITDVSKWLGHRDINVTFSIYGHLVPASWERARGVLDAEWASR